MKKAFFLALALLAIPARAQAPVQAHPALWHVQGPRGEAWLLGSVHILPPGVNWRTPAIKAALARADTFVFEVPEDAAAKAKVEKLIQVKGYLPEGQTLRGLLPPASQADLDAALAASGVPESVINRQRPWLAGLQLMFAQIAKLNFNADNGVDAVLMAEARKAGKPLRHLETIETQFALLAPDDAKLEMEEFQSGLKDLRDVTANIQPMVDAWSAGDLAKLDALINGDLAAFPQARKALLDDRNAAWVPQIRAMLGQKHAYFITVGAGHLTGPGGVPALLRAAGYKVEGP